MKMIRVNNANLAVYEYSKVGDPVLLLHPGGIFASYVWKEFAEKLTDDYRVVAMDIRGHGQSEMTASRYDMDNLALDVSEVLNKLNINQVHIVGNSLGAELGVHFSREYPEKVLSLCLLDGGILNIVGEDGERGGTKEELISERVNRPYPEFSGREEFVQFAHDHWPFFAKVANEIPLHVLPTGNYTFQQPNEIAGRLLESSCDMNMQDYYKHLACPVLFLPAELEGKLEVKLRIINEIEDQLPFSKTVVIPGSTHIMMLDHADQLAIEIRSFLVQVQTKVVGEVNR